MINVTLYMAMSLNGMVARPDDETDFVSDVEWEKGFFPAIKKAGNIVVGRITYDIMREGGNFPDNVQVVVVSKNRNLSVDAHHKLVASPEEALSFLNEAGQAEILVAGGSQLNGSFLKQGLVDNVVLDIEPCLLAKGKVLANAPFPDVKLLYQNMRKLDDNLVQLHYRVQK